MGAVYSRNDAVRTTDGHGFTQRGGAAITRQRILTAEIAKIAESRREEGDHFTTEYAEYAERKEAKMKAKDKKGGVTEIFARKANI